jgi:hypothetical protein
MKLKRQIVVKRQYQGIVNVFTMDLFETSRSPVSMAAWISRTVRDLTELSCGFCTKRII